MDKQQPVAQLYVKHFTPSATGLKVYVWYDNGSYDLVNVFRLYENGKRVEFTLHGEFTPRQNREIVYIHLVKQTRWLFFLPNPDVFVLECKVVQRQPPLNGENMVLGHFSFNGFVRNRSVAVKNVLYTGNNVVTADVLRKERYAKRMIVDDVLVPRLNWAPNYMVYDSKSKQDAFLQAGGLLSIFSTSPLTMIVNYGLLAIQDTNRYQKIPGFTAIPTPDFAFADKKGIAFLGSALGNGPKRAAGLYVSETAELSKQWGYWPFSRRIEKPWAYSRVDFTKFLQDTAESERDVETRKVETREVDAVRHIVAHHEEDEEFGRLFLESLFCSQLQRKTPDTNNETLQWLDALARECGADLDTDIFFLDFSSLVGVPNNDVIGGHFAPARVLLQLRGNKLKPIGISLHSEVVGWRTHLPAQRSWAVAKLFAKCAAGLDHEIVQHALHTHLVLEPFAVALEKKVPLDHFVYRLLKQHFRYTIDVNFKARSALISAGGLFDKFTATGGTKAGHMEYMNKMYKSWDAKSLHFIEDMKRRGFDLDVNGELNVNDSFPLPGYLYAQDGFDLWKSIHTFVRDLTLVQYPTEQAYADDHPLRNFFMEAQTNGFPTVKKLFPASRESFIELCTGIIFTASAQHAAINFPQFAHYSYVASSPLMLINPAPAPGHDALVNDFLPKAQEALASIAAVWGLSRFTRGDERYMYSDNAEDFFNQSLFNDPKFSQICRKLRSDFREIENNINTRAPSAYGTKYRWLLPSKIPTSVAT